MSRKEEIINRAIGIAVEKGFKSVTIKSLAEACGITEPAIYRHFRNKDEIIIAVIDRLQERVLSIIRKGLEKTTIASLEKTIYEILSMLGELKGIGILLLSESAYTNNAVLKERLYEFYNDFVGKFEDFYHLLKDRRAISERADCTALAVMTIALFQSASVRFILSDGRIPIEHKAQEMVSILLKGAGHGA